MSGFIYLVSFVVVLVIVTELSGAYPTGELVKNEGGEENPSFDETETLVREERSATGENKTCHKKEQEHTKTCKKKEPVEKKTCKKKDNVEKKTCKKKESGDKKTCKKKDIVQSKTCKKKKKTCEKKGQGGKGGGGEEDDGIPALDFPESKEKGSGSKPGGSQTGTGSEDDGIPALDFPESKESGSGTGSETKPGPASTGTDAISDGDEVKLDFQDADLSPNPEQNEVIPGSSKKSNPHSKKKRGKGLSGRITKGTDVDPTNKFSSIVLIVHDHRQESSDGGKNQDLCAGVIIGEQYVATTTGCADDDDLESYTIFAGKYNVNETGGNEQKVKVSKLYRHPDYNSETSENDLVMLKVDPGFKENADVSIGSLGSESGNTTTATAVGWGKLSEDDPKDFTAKQQGVVLTLHSTETCAKKYPEDDIFDTQVCAGGESDGKGVCDGDVGGPLIVDNPKPDSPNQILGLLSWNGECGGADQPAVFTRPYAFSIWINSVISGNEDTASRVDAGSSPSKPGAASVKPGTGSGDIIDSVPALDFPDADSDSPTDIGSGPKPDQGAGSGTKPEEGTGPETKPDQGTGPGTKPEEGTGSGTKPGSQPATGGGDDVIDGVPALDFPDTDSDAGNNMPGTGPETKPAQGTGPGTKPDQGTGPVTKPDQGTEPGTKPDQGTGPGTKPDQGTEPGTKPDQGTGPGTKPEQGAGSGTKPGSQPAAGGEDDTLDGVPALDFPASDSDAGNKPGEGPSGTKPGGGSSPLAPPSIGEVVGISGKLGQGLCMQFSNYLSSKTIGSPLKSRRFNNMTCSVLNWKKLCDGPDCKPFVFSAC